VRWHSYAQDWTNRSLEYDRYDRYDRSKEPALLAIFH